MRPLLLFRRRWAACGERLPLRRGARALPPFREEEEEEEGGRGGGVVVLQCPREPAGLLPGGGGWHTISPPPPASTPGSGVQGGGPRCQLPGGAGGGGVVAIHSAAQAGLSVLTKENGSVCAWVNIKFGETCVSQFRSPRPLPQPHLILVHLLDVFTQAQAKAPLLHRLHFCRGAAEICLSFWMPRSPKNTSAEKKFF